MTSGVDPTETPNVSSAWTVGNKTVLLMRIDFPDRTGEPISEANALTLLNTNSNNFYRENSFNKTSLQGTVTPVLRMPQTSTFYSGNNNYTQLMNDARAASAAAGFNTNNYNLDIVAFASIGFGWSGLGYVGAKGSWLQGGGVSAGVACHELGHNFGVWHANYWSAQNYSIIGTGANQEYGNSFDTMGAASAGNNHFNAWFKNRFDWLAGDDVQTVTASGTYRIMAYDFATATGVRALKIPRDSTKNYWVEFRQRITGNVWMMNGALINWGYNTNTGSHLLDMTPLSGDGKTDAAIVIGSTFSDAFAGVHITPIGKVATTPASLDVVVKFGTPPDNQAPTVVLSADTTSVAPGAPITFTATAYDPNGDPLAFHWDFADRTVGTNNGSLTKTWTAAGQYVVRCVASDMQGGTASDSLIVTVGAPSATLQVGGRITFNNQPVSDTLVTATLSGQSTPAKRVLTDSEGTYTLVGLAAGTYTVAAARNDYTFAPTFANPVVLQTSTTNADFNAQLARYTITGRITDNNIGVGGAVVTDGTRSAVTAATGNYTLNGVPNGAYTLGVRKAGYEFAPVGSWRNPVEVNAGNVAARDFVRPLVTVGGAILGATQAVTVGIGDTVHTTTSFNQGGAWRYSLQVPRGQWNLLAALGGFTLAPDNFANPVTVTGALSNRNFRVTTGATYTLSGTVTANGAPVSGVVVGAGTRSGVSDTEGRFTIIGAANGTYTLTPHKRGYRFLPATRSVTITNANRTGLDFTADEITTKPPISSSPD